MMTYYSGGTSMELLKKDINMAIEDSQVDSILLDIDSPGGTVDGTKEAADAVLKAREEKPVIAYVNGMMASAALWIGTAANHVVTGETAQNGSIGVTLTHYDYSAQDEKSGIKRTVLSAGAYKRIASDEKPLTQEGREYLQGQLDTYYTMFVDAVARNRGTDADTVLNKMADGKIFIGEQAVKAGIADQTGTFEDAVGIAKEKIYEEKNNITTQEDSKMTKDELKKDHPDIYNAIFEDGKAEGAAEGKAAAETEALETVATERDTEVLALVAAGFGAEVQTKLKCMLDAKMTASQVEAAKAALGTSSSNEDDAEAKAKQEILDRLKADGEGGVDTSGKVDNGSGSTDFYTKVKARMDKKSCGEFDAIKHCRADDEEGYEAWMKTTQPTE